MRSTPVFPPCYKIKPGTLWKSNHPVILSLVGEKRLEKKNKEALLMVVKLELKSHSLERHYSSPIFATIHLLDEHGDINQLKLFSGDSKIWNERFGIFFEFVE